MSESEAVKLEHICKEYSHGVSPVLALCDINLKVRRGEFCAFIGPSGCGKSTLLNIIAGLDRPTSGRLALEGRSAEGLTSAEWTIMRRERLGIVFQAFHLIPGLTAADNVALPLLLKGEKGSAAAKRVQEVLETVGMWARRDHSPAELSGGEQQRVAIARAIVHRPRLILADEPTGNLDSKTGGEIIDQLQSLSRQCGHTVLLVTHSWAAAQAADSIWEMADGRLMGQITQYNAHPV